jgi:hypothetical protein
MRESLSGLEYEIDHAAACVRSGLRESPIMPLSESIEIAAVFNGALNEKNAGKDVRCDENCGYDFRRFSV